MAQFNELVSIVFVLESDLDTTVNLFKNLREQTYKNVEYLLVYASGFDIEAFKTTIYNDTDLTFDVPVKYLQSEYGIGLMDRGIEEASGSIIFLKATGPVLWYPGHIEAHIKKHLENKMKNSVVLSLLEVKNMFINHKSPISTIGFRYNKKLGPTDIVVDEVSFTPDVEIRFKKYAVAIDQSNNIVELDTPGARLVYDPRKFTDHIRAVAGSFKFADTITVLTLIPAQDPSRQMNAILTQSDWAAVQTDQSVNDDFSIRHRIPTLFGNTQVDEQWNNKIRSFIAQYCVDMLLETDMKIIIKRTVGMGDVIETEPVIRWLRHEYPNAEIWFVTSASRGCADIVKLFESAPDVILTIKEEQLLTDMLGRTNLPKLLRESGHKPDTKFDLRFDLDLSYESRPKTRFVDGYFQTIGIDSTKLLLQELIPRLNITNKNYQSDCAISVCLNGSGWEGKELNAQDVEYVLRSVKKKGYDLHHTSSLPEKYKHLTHIFEDVNVEDDFAIMLGMINFSHAYIGADNGPFHIASALDIPVFIWNGAALTEFTSAYPELTVLKHEELSCLGCKHEMFYRSVPIAENQYTLTFVPECKNAKQFACMDSFSNTVLEQQIEEFCGKLILAKRENNKEEIYEQQ